MHNISFCVQMLLKCNVKYYKFRIGTHYTNYDLIVKQTRSCQSVSLPVCHSIRKKIQNRICWSVEQRLLIYSRATWVYCSFGLVQGYSYYFGVFLYYELFFELPRHHSTKWMKIIKKYQGVNVFNSVFVLYVK